ncbi:hypothetical protein [Methylobacillus sp.]|uniref:hypothetical protein n=1 Tax=Methylobacillus sp. TaxID=56818 RepID=UPI0012D04C19|nr:hypothetical protein [Methylobacillus sp.]MPS48483.1 hypothetical protein [Methylobacillus sp.]
MMKVLGIDPSLNNFGFAHALFDPDTGRINVTSVKLATTDADKKNAKQVRKNSDDLRRARILHQAMMRECEGVDFAFIEVPVGSQSARAMASYGICVGVLAGCPIPFFEQTPTAVKLAALNNKTATKEQMIEWAMKKYPATNWLTTKRGGVAVPIAANEHLADAVAAIHAGTQSVEFLQALALARRM